MFELWQQSVWQARSYRHPYHPESGRIISTYIDLTAAPLKLDHDFRIAKYVHVLYSTGIQT